MPKAAELSRQSVTEIQGEGNPAVAQDQDR
jgi:hypothetical protein